MTERERLIELLRNAEVEKLEAIKMKSFTYSSADFTADYLLANGVIIKPCNVGDAVYILAGHNGHKYEKDICEGFYIGNDGVVQVRVRNKKGNHGTYGVMGITVFLTKEEAEKALKEMKSVIT